MKPEILDDERILADKHHYSQTKASPPQWPMRDDDEDTYLDAGQYLESNEKTQVIKHQAIENYVKRRSSLLSENGIEQHFST